MKKLASFLIFILACSNCSFDNKTGIWKDASLENIKKKEEKRNVNLKDVFLENKIFEDEKDSDSKIKITLSPPFKNKSWLNDYFSLTNNIPNIYYENKKLLLFKSSRLSRNFGNKDILFHNNSVISSDNKGTIYIYSLNQKKKIFEYNFYKKKI